ncbi:unnamed protein product [Gadus morhua 'NCC']
MARESLLSKMSPPHNECTLCNRVKHHTPEHLSVSVCVTPPIARQHCRRKDEDREKGASEEREEVSAITLRRVIYQTVMIGTRNNWPSVQHGGLTKGFCVWVSAAFTRGEGGVNGSDRSLSSLEISNTVWVVTSHPPAHRAPLLVLEEEEEEEEEERPGPADTGRACPCPRPDVPRINITLVRRVAGWKGGQRARYANPLTSFSIFGRGFLGAPCLCNGVHLGMEGGLGHDV